MLRRGSYAIRSRPWSFAAIAEVGGELFFQAQARPVYEGLNGGQGAVHHAADFKIGEPFVLMEQQREPLLLRKAFELFHKDRAEFATFCLIVRRSALYSKRYKTGLIQLKDVDSVPKYSVVP